MRDEDVRAALLRHWQASDANDVVAEHEIYGERAVLEYPRSGERMRGAQAIQAVSGTQGAPILASRPHFPSVTLEPILGHRLHTGNFESPPWLDRALT